jgi:3-oxoadipate enol-lactonase
VVTGAGDLALPPEHQQGIVEGIAGAEWLTVDPAAHLANLEQPEQVSAALLAHLDAAGPGRIDPAGPGRDDTAAGGSR